MIVQKPSITHTPSCNTNASWPRLPSHAAASPAGEYATAASASAAVAADATATAIAAAAAAASGAGADAVVEATAKYVPSPIEPGWEIWVGFIAGVVPFLIGSWEFGKRIIIQLRCPLCAGRGLVPSTKPGTK